MSSLRQRGYLMEGESEELFERKGKYPPIQIRKAGGREFRDAKDDAKAKAIAYRIPFIREKLDEAEAAYKKWMSSERESPSRNDLLKALQSVETLAGLMYKQVARLMG